VFWSGEGRRKVGRIGGRMWGRGDKKGGGTRAQVRGGRVGTWGGGGPSASLGGGAFRAKLLLLWAKIVNSRLVKKKEAVYCVKVNPGNIIGKRGCRRLPYVKILNLAQGPRLSKTRMRKQRVRAFWQSCEPEGCGERTLDGKTGRRKGTGYYCVRTGVLQWGNVACF